MKTNKVKKKFSFTLSRKTFAFPYILFMLVFTVLPLFIILAYAFIGTDSSFTFDNIVSIFTDGVALKSIWMALWIGMLTTVICLILAYPLCLILSNPKYNRSYIFVMLFITPMWINFLLRTVATKFLFEYFGMNDILFNTILGMIYNFLPFMILPIYTTLVNMDKSLIEAAQDLGANPRKVLFKTIVPLSMPGVISGITMVFMPTISTYAISDILSNSMLYPVGTVLEFRFKYNQWGTGSAVSLVLLVFVGISIIITNRFSGNKNAKGGLW